MSKTKLSNCGFLICAFNTGGGQCRCASVSLDKYGQCVVSKVTGQELAPYRDMVEAQSKETEEVEVKNPIGFAG